MSHLRPRIRSQELSRKGEMKEEKKERKISRGGGDKVGRCAKSRNEKKKKRK